MKEIKAFDWEKEFDLTPGPSPQGEGSREWGFDCVIGNPPYGADLSESARNILRINSN